MKLHRVGSSATLTHTPAASASRVDGIVDGLVAGGRDYQPVVGRLAARGRAGSGRRAGGSSIAAIAPASGQHRHGLVHLRGDHGHRRTARAAGRRSCGLRPVHRPRPGTVARHHQPDGVERGAVGRLTVRRWWSAAGTSIGGPPCRPPPWRWSAASITTKLPVTRLAR